MSLWAEIDVDIDFADTVSQIEQWFNNPSEECIRVGDINCCSFAGNVVCFEIKMEQEELIIPLHTIDPYTCSFIIVYYLRPLLSRICIVGGITWNRVVKQNGRIDVIRDLSKNRCFEPDYSNYNQMDKMGKKDDVNVVLPLHLNRTTTNQLENIVFPLEVMRKRVNWYLTNKHHSFTPDEHVWGMLFMRHVAKLVPEIWKQHITLETETLHKLLHSATQNESNFVSLLGYNGISHLLTDTTPADRQYFLTYYPHLAPPFVALCVPQEDTSVSQYLPVYDGGKVHIMYPDVAKWASDLFLSQGRLPLTIHCEQAEEPAFVIREWLKTNRAPKHKQEHKEFQIDREDWISLMPPCVRATLESKRFPLNTERLHLVLALKNGGVPYEKVEAWFEKQFVQCENKGTHRSALERFNYKAAWEQKDQKYYGVSCGKIIKTQGSLVCPFGEDIEDARQKCGNPWNGPHNLIRKTLGNCSSLRISYDDNNVSRLE